MNFLWKRIDCFVYLPHHSDESEPHWRKKFPDKEIIFVFKLFEDKIRKFLTFTVVQWLYFLSMNNLRQIQIKIMSQNPQFMVSDTLNWERLGIGKLPFSAPLPKWFVEKRAQLVDYCDHKPGKAYEWKILNLENNCFDNKTELSLNVALAYYISFW